MRLRDTVAGPYRRLTKTFGVRLALWYFLLFAAGTTLVLVLAYALLAASLRARDRDALDDALVRYGRAYERGGLAAIQSTLAADRLSASYEPLLVRIDAPGGSAVFASLPRGWEAEGEQLDIASARLPGGVVLQVGRSTDPSDQLLATFRGSALLLVAAVVIMGLAGGAAVTWSALRPLRDLSATVQSILRTGSTRTRVPVGRTGDALDELALLINQLLDRIDALLAAMRGSLDNVAHDLRTPVTRLRATAESALEHARPPEAYRDALADCLEESERIVILLDALLDIAEAETGVMRLRLESVDVVALLHGVVDLYEDVAENRRIALAAHTPDALSTVADRGRLNQAVANLVDNAVKYTPPGGRVTLSAATDETGAAVIAVEDTGPGIGPVDLPRIWDRLYRGDQSRSQRGLGLGLSLVKAIAEAHGGTVEVTSRPGGGSRFILRLPERRLPDDRLPPRT